MASVDEQLRAYLKGLTESPEIQAPLGKPGDPQLIAFRQYLQLRIDFPRLLTGCRRLAYFAGYSERALFARAPTVAAMEKLIEEGRDLRILLTDLDAAAVLARSAAPLYTEENRLPEEIRRSVAAFDQLRERLVGRVGVTARDRCRLRLTKQLPACAFFSSTTTASRGCTHSRSREAADRVSCINPALAGSRITTS